MMQAISGGAPGVDVGFLKGAKRAGLKTCGFAPKKFEHDKVERTEQKDLYGLVDSNAGHGTKDRMNVDQADFLIAHRVNIEKSGRGVMQTRNYALFGDYVYHGEKKDDKVFSAEKYKMELPFATLTHRSDVWLNTDGKIPVIEVWGLHEENKELTPDKFADMAHDVAKILVKYKPKKVMVSGPTERTCKCEDLLEKFYMVVFTLATAR